jgi:hypothetical protein
MGSTAKVRATPVEPPDNPSELEVRAFLVGVCSLHGAARHHSCVRNVFDGKFRVLFLFDTVRVPEATVATAEASFSKPAQLQSSAANFRPDSQSQAFPPEFNQEGSAMRIVRAIQISMCAAVLCVTFVTAAQADIWDKKTIVTFGDSVEIPGQVLPAGTYVFKLVNSASDRHIVQIWNADETQILATILTIPNYRLDLPDRTIFEFDERPSDSPMALHSWFYPGDNIGQEFVYARNREINRQN